MSGLATDLFYETFTPLAQVGAQSINGATVLSAACDMKNVYRLIALINVGVMTATGTMDAKFVQAVTSGGTYKDITGHDLVLGVRGLGRFDQRQYLRSRTLFASRPDPLETDNRLIGGR